MQSESEFKSFLTKSPNTNKSYISSLKSKAFHNYSTTLGISDVFTETDIAIIKSLFDGLCDKTNGPAMTSIKDSNGASRSAIREYAAYLRAKGYATNDSGQDFNLMKASRSGSTATSKQKLTKVLSVPWASILKKYEDYLIKNGISPNSYISRLNTIHNRNGNATMLWFNKAIFDPLPLDFLDNEFLKLFPQKTGANNDRKTALRTFGKFIISSYKADICLKAVPKFDELACQLVASTAVFCEKDVAYDVFNGVLGSKDNKANGGNQYYSWECCTIRRAKPQEKGIKVLNGIRLDDNTYANGAIKRAVSISMKRKFGITAVPKHIFDGFEACHIWDSSCYDERYYTSVTNLVLIPRGVAGLSDHCAAVKDLLKYEAWQRFHFKPDGEPNPTKPKNYKKVIWR